jgi:hypothetical protein
MNNAQRRCTAQGQAAAAEILPHKCRSILIGQCTLGAPGTLIDILHRMPVLCIPALAAHNPAHMRGVRSTWRQAPRMSGNRFRSQHERGPTRYRRLPAPHRRIAARLLKLAMTTERQAQG